MRVYELHYMFDDEDEYHPTLKSAMDAVKVYGRTGYTIYELEIGSVSSRKDACNLLNGNDFVRSRRIVEQK